ncbi:MAG: UDP-N-acetylglucosamine 2-epimerase (non-hydrolyzing) [Methanobacterium sp.]|uniref:non-hydrolyzing UDP-N-acetylglucosamine 2-epimerase n=1 Tax=Methanobacterium sp. TaxID=2164 RepID=UPI003D65C859|nr:UDP-N-acetylglucosamine 2-epimerase (non-hydrolyzing) [Methanobacterium sp.]
MKIVTILGTRPEIIKLSPIIPLIDKEFDHILIHTGQHYSYNMDKIFFEELGLRNCDYSLNVGSGTHSMQTGKMMIEIENVLLNENPDWVIVQGDTNSTLAGAITASKLNIKIAHVEAGCRSFDKKMPEEINRILVDHCSDILFAPDENAVKNLAAEGIQKEAIHLVGNTSVDACLRIMDLFNLNRLTELNLEKENYILLTIHRQENTEYNKLKEIIKAVNQISNRIKVVFPLHLRTKKIIEDNNIEISENILQIDPVGYKEFIWLLKNSKFVMTDSGGIQEESAILNVPCLILRDNTEWEYLVNMGKTQLVGTNYKNIISSVSDLLNNNWKLEKMKNIKAPLKKNASKKIVNILMQYQ